MNTERAWALVPHLVAVSIYLTSSQSCFWPSFCSRDWPLPIEDSHRVLERQQISKCGSHRSLSLNRGINMKMNKLSSFSNCWRTGRGSLSLTTRTRCLTWTMSNFSTRPSGTFSNTLKLWKLTLGGSHPLGGVWSRLISKPWRHAEAGSFWARSSSHILLAHVSHLLLLALGILQRAYPVPVPTSAILRSSFSIGISGCTR